MNDYIIPIEEARDTLRVDGSDYDEIIFPLLSAIPSYLEETTGYDWLQDDFIHPLAQATAKFILELWFDTQTEDSERLRRTIDTLLTSLTLIGRKK